MIHLCLMEQIRVSAIGSALEMAVEMRLYKY